MDKETKLKKDIYVIQESMNRVKDDGTLSSMLKKKMEELKKLLQGKK
jgi:hypothetical protein